jgi:hypothetical protein
MASALPPAILPLYPSVNVAEVAPMTKSGADALGVALRSTTRAHARGEDKRSCPSRHKQHAGKDDRRSPKTVGESTEDEEHRDQRTDVNGKCENDIGRRRPRRE